MSHSIYLIDANSLITPHLSYYPFDFAPGFWTQIEKLIQDGRIAILDLVKDEILKGNDSLKDWMDGLSIGTRIDHREEKILKQYALVLQYIADNRCYKPSALQEWSKQSVADPWLIAAASVYHQVLVTFETPNNGLNDKFPSKQAKIPDVAENFGVKTITLFQMMRELGIQLR
jgi:hypothetical protein